MYTLLYTNLPYLNLDIRPDTSSIHSYIYNLYITYTYTQLNYSSTVQHQYLLKSNLRPSQLSSWRDQGSTIHKTNLSLALPLYLCSYEAPTHQIYQHAMVQYKPTQQSIVIYILYIYIINIITKDNNYYSQQKLRVFFLRPGLHIWRWRQTLAT